MLYNNPYPSNYKAKNAILKFDPTPCSYQKTSQMIAEQNQLISG